MAKRIDDNLVIEGARIIFRNFTGTDGGKFNTDGDRNFCVVLDNETATKLNDDGWKVRILKPREEGDEPLNYLPVSIRYDYVPPVVYMVPKNNKKKKTLLNEDTISILQYADIAYIDITIRPYNWSMPSGASGVKAYTKTLYVVVEEDEFASKYDDENEDITVF